MRGMNRSDLIADAIATAGGNQAVGRAFDLSDEGVRLWKERGVPGKYVIRLCELGQWKYRPNDIDDTLYPHPDDGLPPDRRSAGGEAVAVGAD